MASLAYRIIFLDRQLNAQFENGASTFDVFCAFEAAEKTDTLRT